MILAEAAQVFSVHGYAGASMDDLTRATGMTKGAIYHYFGSKDDLVFDAFELAVDQMQARLNKMIDGIDDPLEQLLAFAGMFRSLIDDPILKGGCPILNAAVEVDDTNPALRERVQRRMTGWRRFVTDAVERGKQTGVFRPDTAPDMVATVFIAALEGAIMMSKLYGETHYLDQAVSHLTDYLTSLQVGENL